MKTALLVFLMTTALASAADYSAVIARFEDAVKEEMREWEIEGIAAAWVDGTQIVHEAGYGEAQKDSVFRCGSVSKLFNAVAVMQQVETGKLDLDAPVERYVPGLVPINPFSGSPAPTLRHLLSHRSGLQRESSVGGYFDPDDPGILASVESLRGNALVTIPNAMTRYSNIGPTLAGYALELATNVDFEKYQAQRVLGPLGMKRSAWRHVSLPSGVTCLKSYMRIADGKGGFPRKETPLFDLGTIPAGNLFTTAGDLARFIIMLAFDGDAPGGRVLKADTLSQMYKPQHEERGAFGIGFSLGEMYGRKTVGHGGAVYGHSTQLVFLPGEKIGVVVLANEDIANGRISRLAALAVELMLEAKNGAIVTPIRVATTARQKSTYTKGSRSVTVDTTASIELGAFIIGGNFAAGTTVTEIVDATRLEVSSPALEDGTSLLTYGEKPVSIEDFVGDYESQSYWAELRVKGGELRGNISSQPCVFVPLRGDTFILRSRIHADVPVDFVRDAKGRVISFNSAPQVFQRVPGNLPKAPASWKALYGSFGPEFIPLVVFEKFGHLYASTENMVDYRLTPVTRHIFALPPGMYIEEELVFHMDAKGKAVAAELASMMLLRLK